MQLQQVPSHPHTPFHSLRGLNGHILQLCLVDLGSCSFDRTFNLSYSAGGVEVGGFLEEGSFTVFNVG